VCDKVCKKVETVTCDDASTGEREGFISGKLARSVLHK